MARTPDGHYLERGYLICPIDGSTRHLGHHEFECVCGVHKVAGDGTDTLRGFWTHAEVKRHRVAMRERAMQQRIAAGFGVMAR